MDDADEQQVWVARILLEKKIEKRIEKTGSGK
jgi:hypothetical protein